MKSSVYPHTKNNAGEYLGTNILHTHNTKNGRLSNNLGVGVYGFDFGTSNSAISLLKEGEAVVLPLGDGGGDIVRTVMFFPEGSHESIIGEGAIRDYVDSGMRGRFISSFKSMLPVQAFLGTTIHGKWFSPEEIVAGFLAHMKQRADRLVGEDVKRVVLGRPVVFSANPKDEQLALARLENAAHLAGFEEVRFQTEPVAAALNFEAQLTEETLVFVVDMGGGTSDFTVMKVSPRRRGETDRSGDILASGGEPIGGDKFSSQIMRHKLIRYFGSDIIWRSLGGKNLPMPLYIMETICDWKKTPYLKEERVQKDLEDILRLTQEKLPVERLLGLIRENLGFSVFESIELAKRNLSDRDRETINYHRSLIDISEPISRGEYEHMIQPDLKRIERCVLATLERSGLAASEVDVVFLTGGTSKTPAVKTMISNLFPSSAIEERDSFTSVVAGLARSIPLFRW